MEGTETGEGKGENERDTNKPLSYSHASNVFRHPALSTSNSISPSTLPDVADKGTLRHLSECFSYQNKINHDAISPVDNYTKDVVECQVKNIDSGQNISLPALPNSLLKERSTTKITDDWPTISCNCPECQSGKINSVHQKVINSLPEEDVDTDSDSDEEDSSKQSEFEVIIYDPSIFMPLPTQIAGHGSEGDGEKGFLKRLDGRLLKPVQAPPRGRRELDFYKRINASKCPVDTRLLKSIPEFFGIEKVGFKNGIIVTEEFLILRDITEGFAQPAIMDIKIGSRTWGPDASAKKQAQEDSKYPGTKHPFGFSILGLIVHSLTSEAEDNGVGCHGRKYNKSFGKNLKTEDAHTVPEIFFDVQESERMQESVAICVDIMVRQIRTIYEAFEVQRKYKIYGSSLLMAYDADALRRFIQGKIDRTEMEKYVNVKLIDFAHVFPSNGERDDNFLRGLSNVLTLFQNFYKGISPSDLKSYELQ